MSNAKILPSAKTTAPASWYSSNSKGEIPSYMLDDWERNGVDMEEVEKEVAEYKKEIEKRGMVLKVLVNKDLDDFLTREIPLPLGRPTKTETLEKEEGEEEEEEEEAEPLKVTTKKGSKRGPKKMTDFPILTCIICKETKPKEEFGKGRLQCIVCRKEYKRKHAGQVKMRTPDQRKELQRIKYPNGIKQCTLCNKRKILSEFYNNSQQLDGLCSECKDCGRSRVSEQTGEFKNRSDLQIAQDIINHFGDVYTATKRCNSCNEVKSLDNYRIKRSNLNGVDPNCALCSKKRSHEKSLKLKEFRYANKQGKVCATCGFGDIRCLDFAHYNRADKARTKTGKPIQPSGLSRSRFILELNKGRFLCRICHANETIEEIRNNLSQNSKAVRSRRITYDRRKCVDLEKLSRGCCSDCKLAVTLNNVHLFDFDHRSRDNKVLAVSTMTSKGLPVPVIINEMKKCDLRCKNCHMIKTLVNEESGSLPKDDNDVKNVISVLSGFFMILSYSQDMKDE